jgi:AbrB family looped-hinge helix DNA binding protein
LSVNFKTIGIAFLGGCRILAKLILGKMTVEEVTVDQKGRVQIPKSIRDRVGLHVGGKARLKIEKENIVIMPPISPEEFIKEMEGCIKGGTPNTDPLKLKKMWEPTEK